MAVFLDGRCACSREVCDITCMTYAAYMYKQDNIGTWQERIKKKPITNADRIRSMTDEELAKKMSGLESFALTCGGGWPPEKWLDWLKQECSDEL